MRRDAYIYLDLLLLLGSLAVVPSCVAIPHAESLERRSSSNPLNIDWDPAPSPEDGPALSAGAIRDPAYLPIQIGGIVGSYAVSLVLVAIGLLALAKTRREHLRAGEAVENGELDLPTFQFEIAGAFTTEEEYSKTVKQYHEQQEVDLQQRQHNAALYSGQHPYPQLGAKAPRALHHNVPYPLETPKTPYKNFSRPDLSPVSPIRAEYNGPFTASPVSAATLVAPGYDLAVDQSVILSDREMAQQQLEDMYRHVMEQEEAKAQGLEYHGPTLPGPPQQAKAVAPSSSSGNLKKEKNKPVGLNLDRDEKSPSRGSSIFSLLKSPRKKNSKVMSISSPIMTPMSGTFPRYGEGEEMNAIPPRQYAPAPPPPVPTDRSAFYQRGNAGNALPLTPEMSPTSIASIDGRIDAVTRQSRDIQETSHRRDPSAMTESSMDPISATSEKSTTPLVGLPTSPKPGVSRFPSHPASPRAAQQSFPRDSTLPSSPKPGQTFQRESVHPFQREPAQQAFQRSNAPAAIRAGDSLPLRAYEHSLASPRLGQQTVFTRAGPLSPGLGTPYTGAAVPYSPYQPFSPVIPITPSLVTKEDRKRMRKMEPKTPTVEMVMSSDEIW